MTENEARRALIDTCRQMNALGINQGKSGNASLRWHRGGADGYLITPSALPYDRMSEDDIVWLALQADPEAPAPGALEQVFPQAPRVRAGPNLVSRRRPSSEWRMHRMIHRDLPGAGAVVHVHSTFATSLACLPAIQAGGIPAFHYMVAVAGGDNIRCARYETFGTEALSQAAAQALQQRRACLLANHGQLAYAGDLDGALALAVEVERLCRMYAQALQLGTPTILDGEQMRQVIEKFEQYRSSSEEAEQ